MCKMVGRVSVIMPVYNAMPYLTDAIESILHQTYKDFEFNIIDDGSTDESLSVIKKYSDLDKRIRYFSRENRGLSKTLNELIDMSSGEYLIRMDADDISEINRIEKQIDYLEKNRNVTVLGGIIKVIGSEELKFIDTCPSNESRRIRMLFENVGVAHPAAAIRKSFIKNNGIRYSVENKGCEDYEMWVDILNNGGVIDSLNDVVLNYRVFPNQKTNKYAKDVYQWDNNVKKKQLAALGDFTEKEIEIFLNFGKNELYGITREYYMFFKHIIKANREKHIYDNDTLRKEIVFKWIIKAQNRAKKNNDFSFFNIFYIIGLMKPTDIIYVVKCIKDLLKSKNKKILEKRM